MIDGFENHRGRRDALRIRVVIIRQLRNSSRENPRLGSLSLHISVFDEVNLATNEMKD